MKCTGRARVAGNALSTSSRSINHSSAMVRAGSKRARASSSCTSPVKVKGRMSDQKRQSLWTPSHGIRFSPRQSVTYPDLSTARSSHDLGRQDEIPRDSHAADVAKAELARISHAGHGRPLTSRESQPDPKVKTQTSRKSAGKRASRQPEMPAIIKDVDFADLPQSSLSFTMSKERFLAAKESATGSPKSFWSHLMYSNRADAGPEQNVKVHYCMTLNTMEYVCKKHFDGEEVLGFDLEWHPSASKSDSAQKNVSLIQLASPSRIGLFHIARFRNTGDLIGETFRKIMEDVNVLKVGVNIRGDCTRLKTHLGVNAQGTFEVSHLYKLVKYSREGRKNMINRTAVSMATQIQDTFNLPIYKDNSVRGGDWSKVLNSTQIQYSAADAYAGIQLFYALEDLRSKLKPCPPRPHLAELGLPIQYAEDELPSEEESDLDLDSEVSDGGVADAELEELWDTTFEADKSYVTDHTEEAPAGQRDYRVIAAEEKADRYRASKRNSVVTQRTALRTYFTWHDNVELDIEAVAGLLRDPPLLTSTVVFYILDAIIVEKLAYDKTRMREEVFPLIHAQALQQAKYSELAKEVQN